MPLLQWLPQWLVSPPRKIKQEPEAAGGAKQRQQTAAEEKLSRAQAIYEAQKAHFEQRSRQQTEQFAEAQKQTKSLYNEAMRRIRDRTTATTSGEVVGKHGEKVPAWTVLWTTYFLMLVFLVYLWAGEGAISLGNAVKLTAVFFLPLPATWLVVKLKAAWRWFHEKVLMSLTIFVFGFVFALVVAVWVRMLGI